MGSHVVVVGGMAVGKSTVGRALAARLGWPFRDSDDDLVADRGITGRALADVEGVAALHRWELTHLLSALAQPEPSVVAAAASVVDEPAGRSALGDQFVVWLRAPAAVVAERLRSAASAHRRRLDATDGAPGEVDTSDVEAGVTALARRRSNRYGAVADLIVDTVVDGTTTSPDRIVDAAVAALGRRRRR